MGKKIMSFDEFVNESKKGVNEFQVAWNFINMFGGKELLSDKNIKNGDQLEKAFEDGYITVEQIDKVTKGKNGQDGDRAWSDDIKQENHKLHFLLKK